ncbi:MAG: methyltransferase domain-containing protein [Actinoallomurus sp.]
MAGSTPHSAVERRIRTAYSSYNHRYHPTETTMYFNLGYWGPECTSLDDACHALADMLADAAGMREGDQVLDVGFGYADEDLRWAELRRPQRIVGLNITPAQVQVAMERARERGLEDRLDLRVGSATEMPFDAGTFDRVVALQSAFHFDTRQDFFAEAYRVLRPGGVLATVDVVLRGTAGREFAKTDAGACCVPAANRYDQNTYRERMCEAGFVNVDIRPISDHVYEPLIGYLTDRLERYKAERVRSVKLLMTESLIANMRKAIPAVEYVIAVGETRT